jgi:NAD(P)-dependent dehydrogenase (short-subunit alcohol dehydrogenase family)
MHKTTTRPTFRAALASLLILCLAGANAALAGMHGGGPKAEDILVDPTQRTDVTGTVLITGSNRGIGLAMARNYAERGWTVIATARSPARADELNALAKEYPQVAVEQLDVTDQASVDALAAKYQGTPIDVLLNNAAILGDRERQNFGDYDFDEFNRVFNTNVAGPLRVSEAFADNVAASKLKKIVAVTSVQGSLTLIRMAAIQFYNASKSALNMSMRAVSAAVKNRGITVVLISPGAVDTEMMAQSMGGRKFPGRLITTEESAEAVINVIDQYGFDMSGTFISHQGAEIPW